ncbi:hypothetical protein BU15DRAFT_66024 [Melanogaster broomeanus]|nr:hypothetical protein BU15DRAFT_66024 [Melanogaster broomeanus]
MLGTISRADVMQRNASTMREGIEKPGDVEEDERNDYDHRGLYQVSDDGLDEDDVGVDESNNKPVERIYLGCHVGEFKRSATSNQVLLAVNVPCLSGWFDFQAFTELHGPRGRWFTGYTEEMFAFIRTAFARYQRQRELLASRQDLCLERSQDAGGITTRLPGNPKLAQGSPNVVPMGAKTVAKPPNVGVPMPFKVVVKLKSSSQAVPTLTINPLNRSRTNEFK